jgi:hypothetical protein
MIEYRVNDLVGVSNRLCVHPRPWIVVGVNVEHALLAVIYALVGVLVEHILVIETAEINDDPADGLFADIVVYIGKAADGFVGYDFIHYDFPHFSKIISIFALSSM